MTLEEGFALTKAKASNSGTNEAWMRGSERGFDASGRLAMAYFGPGVRLRDITPRRSAPAPAGTGRGFGVPCGLVCMM